LKNGPISFVDKSSPNLIGMYGSGRSMQPRFPVDCILYQSGDICSKVAKWRVENYVFRSRNFWGEGPPKSDADILCPYSDTSSRKVWCNSSFPTISAKVHQIFGQFSNFRR